MANNETQEIINRLKSIEGHLRGVTRMVENEANCIEVVNQINAVRAALQKVNTLMLNRYLHTCLKAAAGHETSIENTPWVTQIINLFEAKERKY